MIDRGKLNLLGVRIDAVDYEAAVSRIIEAARARRPSAASALAVHGVMTGVLDAEHRFRLNELDLVVPDGQPVRWALNCLHSAGLTDRVYGPNLMLRVCAAAAEEQLPIFLFGGTAETLTALAGNLCARIPGLTIAGVAPSRFRRLTDAERTELVEQIRESGARITFVGIGCPRQEVWAFEFRERLAMPIVAVGAAFSFHAGTLPQASPRLQRWGLEWSYRLWREPRRLWRRYLLLNPLYVMLCCVQWLRVRRFDPSRSRPPTEELLFG
jgi:exopolysaccharide biosynthesis WecB/TagA/CpsF family protein